MKLLPRILVLALAWGALSVPHRAAAETWLVGEMDDAGERPRTLFGADDIPGLQDRVEREPYLGQLTRLAAMAEWELDPEDHGIDAEQAKANAARAAAFLVLLDRTVEDGAVVAPDDTQREALAERATAYLLAMYTVSRAKGLVDFTEDIHTAQELHLWADTLDWLIAADVLAGDERAQAAQNVADLAADFYADFEISNWVATRALVNNHRSKSAAALGLAAIALNGEDFDPSVVDGRYDPALWVDFAVRYTDFVLRDVLLDRDGGIQEGGGYVVYSGIDHVPFLWAWHRYTAAAPYTVEWDEALPPYYVTGATEPYTEPDLWTDPRLERHQL